MQNGPHGYSAPQPDLLRLESVRRLLCIGACCPDIELGAGATIASIIAKSPGIEVWWVVLGCESPKMARECRRAARLFLQGAAKSKVTIHGFRKGCIPFQGEQVLETFEELSRAFAPDLIFANRDNGTLDHRLVSAMTREMWRYTAILEYDVFVGNGELAPPNVYVPLDTNAGRKKIERLLKAYAPGRSPPDLDEDLVWSMLRLRGAECGSPEKLAEAFHLRRITCL